MLAAFLAWRSDAEFHELLSSCVRQSIARPGRVKDDADFCVWFPDVAQGEDDALANDIDGRAAHERGSDVDCDVRIFQTYIRDDAHVDDAQDRNLGISHGFECIQGRFDSWMIKREFVDDGLAVNVDSCIKLVGFSRYHLAAGSS